MIRQKKYQASITVEMSYIMPIVLFVLFLLIRTSFYFHDKIILSGLLGETLVTGTQYAREEGRDAIDLKNFLEERVQNKLVILHMDKIEILEDKQQIQVQIEAKNRKMQLHFGQKAKKIQPEEMLRKKKKMDTLVGKENK